MSSVANQPAWLERLNAWDRGFRLWATPLLGPPFVVFALLAPIPPAAFVLMLAALTPGTLVLMWVQARKRRWHPRADERTFLRIAAGLSAVALTLVATFYAMRQWGPVAGAVGAIAYYALVWFTARHVAAQLVARQQRRDAAARATTSE